MLKVYTRYIIPLRYILQRKTMFVQLTKQTVCGSRKFAPQIVRCRTHTRTSVSPKVILESVYNNRKKKQKFCTFFVQFFEISDSKTIYNLNKFIY